MSLIDAIAGLLPARREFDPSGLPDRGPMPEFSGSTGWLNGGPLTKEGLAGQIVLVEFWTYSCVNCVRAAPYVNAWHDAYAGAGLTIIGVHTPEFDFERDPENVRRAVARLGIRHPVALDNDYALWNAYRNRSWPALYFADRGGRIRHRHFGEGAYETSEAVIRALLGEDGQPVSGPWVSGTVGKLADFSKIGSPETYLGFDRQEYLGSPEGVRSGRVQRFTGVARPALNVFYLEGLWEIADEFAAPREPGARLIFRYRAPKLNLVADGGGASPRCDVRLDGRPLGEDERGADVGTDASSVAFNEGRMYELVNDRRGRGEHLLELTFAEPGAKLYAFTFG